MKLSVVIPAYNEEKRITDTLNDVNSYLKTQAYDYEIIVVVNGTTDNTYQVVKNLETTTISKATAYNLEKGGKGYAVTRGILDYATGDIIIFMDADNATPIAQIEKFFPYFDQGYSVVIGSRYLDTHTVKKRQPLFRIILSRGANMLIQLLAVPGIKDTQVGFKAFTRECAQDIFRFVTISRWGFDMEVLTIAIERGYKVKEIAVSWTEHGGGHVPMKAYLESLIDLFKIKIKSWKGDYSKHAA